MGKEKLCAIGELSDDYATDEDSPFGACVVGTCQDMCPAAERATRERLHDISTFEQSHQGHHRTSASLAVKKFCRTQRGMTPSEVRPLPVLKRTMEHLLNILTTQHHSLASTYSFLCDRFRAIRQEMVMQRIGGDSSLQLLLPMIRFHIAAAYSLSQSSAQQEQQKQWTAPHTERPQQRHNSSSVRKSSLTGLDSQHHSKSKGEQLKGHHPSVLFDPHLNLSFLSQCILFAIGTAPEHVSSDESGREASREASGREASGREASRASEGSHSVGGPAEVLAERLGGIALSESETTTSKQEQQKGTGGVVKKRTREEVEEYALVWSYYVLLNLGPQPGMQILQHGWLREVPETDKKCKQPCICSAALSPFIALSQDD